MDEYIGKMLDNRYEILEVVGTGGMAIVYKAMCHRLNRYVAVKILKPDAAADPELRNRFRDESQAVAMLSHPNIVSVYDVSKTENQEYIVMELIDGITLKQYMKQKGGKLPWKEALHFITQVMRALRHAHSRGIIHRDIKPQNIMVLRDGSAKVADFGIAHLSASQKTMNQEALGSVHYISPEQAMGEAVDDRTDIYSAGVVLYEMLTGKLPYEGNSAVSVALKHINSVPPRPRELNPDIPVGLEQITMKAMASDPADRYESAKAMLQDLDAFRKNPGIRFNYSTGDAEEFGLKMADDDRTQVAGAVAAGAAADGEPLKYAAYTEAEEKRVTERDAARARRQEERRRREQRRKNALYGILIAVVVVFLLIFAALFIRNHLLSGAQEAEESAAVMEVPNLLGMQYNEAVLKYGDWFDIEIIDYVEDASEDDGTIASQSVEAGTEVMELGTEIDVIVYKHPDSITIPDVSNMTEAEALTALTDAGFSTDKIKHGEDVYSDTVEEGKVVSTDPAANTPVSADTEITYVLSKGKEQVEVGDYVGKLRAVVEAALKELGLTAEFTEVEDDSPAGTILSQDIVKGTMVDKGSVIKFTVSAGPAEDTNNDNNNNNNNNDNNNNKKTPTTPTNPTEPDDPTDDEPVNDEPTTDEPTTDEPTTDEPTTDEPTTDEPSTDEPADTTAE